ncbi:hypothetical protein NAB35_18180 [Proteus mirabilis]|nr:hypothetical protein [Proteus mirabilis]
MRLLRYQPELLATLLLHDLVVYQLKRSWLPEGGCHYAMLLPYELTAWAEHLLL